MWLSPEKFVNHDIIIALYTQDGFITPGEVLARNITIEGFNLVDLDKNGLIVPAEIDESLVIF